MTRRPVRLTKRERTIGYVILWHGSVMRDSARAQLSRKEVGRLFVHGLTATIWPTRTSARAAMRHAIRAWGKDDPGDWRTVALRAPIGPDGMAAGEKGSEEGVKRMTDPDSAPCECGHDAEEHGLVAGPQTRAAECQVEDCECGGYRARRKSERAR